MKIRRILAALFAVAFVSVPAFAQTLWPNVSVGMSVEEVRAGEPAAAPPTKPETYANGITGDLQIPNYTLAGMAFSVDFLFRDGELTQVALTAKGRPLNADYQQLVELLRSKHGPETSGGKTAIGYETKWENVDGLQIKIFYLSELNRLLKIGYAKAPA